MRRWGIWLLALLMLWGLAGATFAPVVTASAAHVRLVASGSTATTSDGSNYGGNDPNG